MDLHPLQSYRRPRQISDLQGITPRIWQDQGYGWLAGGTWLYSQPQPQLRTLIDLEGLNWSEIEIGESGVTLGATCTLATLSHYPWPSEWRGIPALVAAITSLASFKVAEMATVGGNLCLALTVGSLAPVMGVLGATYEIWDLAGAARWVDAQGFQTGPQQTMLQPGEVLRRIHIPRSGLEAPACFERASLAEIEPALTIVVGHRSPQAYTLGITAALSIPTYLRFPQPPTPGQIDTALSDLGIWIEDYRGSQEYRRHLTTVLIHRCLERLISSI